MRTRFLLALVTAAGLSLSLGPRSAIACPNNCIWRPQAADLCTTAAVLDTIFGHDATTLCSDSCRAAFDVPHGTLLSYAGSGWGGCDPRTVVSDDFTMLGLPAGTPVTLTARFDVSAEAGAFMGDGTVDAQLTVGANSAAVHWGIGTDFAGVGATRTRTLTVPVSALAGAPFTLTCWVGSNLGELCYGDIRGTFTFDGLPAGASIVSCKGFVEAPTPVNPVSWGSVKARYR